MAGWEKTGKGYSIHLNEQYMRRIKTEVLNVIRCDGAVCVSVNNNYKKYYSNGISGRNLNIKKYRYENS